MSYDGKRVVLVNDGELHLGTRADDGTYSTANLHERWAAENADADPLPEALTSTGGASITESGSKWTIVYSGAKSTGYNVYKLTESALDKLVLSTVNTDTTTEERAGEPEISADASTVVFQSSLTTRGRITGRGLGLPRRRLAPLVTPRAVTATMTRTTRRTICSRRSSSTGATRPSSTSPAVAACRSPASHRPRATGGGRRDPERRQDDRRADAVGERRRALRHLHDELDAATRSARTRTRSRPRQRSCSCSTRCSASRRASARRRSDVSGQHTCCPTASSRRASPSATSTIG